MAYNKCLFIGNLTRDPETRFTPKGTTVCGFTIAVNREWKTEAGEKREEVSFLDCEAFGRSAENIGKFFSKGKPIFLEAHAKQDSWEDKTTGAKRTRIKFIVDSWLFCGGDKTERSSAPALPSTSGSGKVDEGGDDVPF